MKGIRTEKLNIGYGSDLIRDICLAVEPGKIVTLIGENGCGKTTLLKTLIGELKDRGGIVYLDGEERSALGSGGIAKRLSVVLTEKVRTEYMTCYEVVSVGRYPYTGALGILSEEDKKKVSYAMAWTDTAHLATDLFRTLSDGQKQRVLLARAICQEPKILVLDEPISFLDIRHKIDLLAKIADFAKEKNVAVLMSLHELSVARQISDTVVALGEGAVQKTGTPEEVFTEDFIRHLFHIEGKDVGLLGVSPWKSGTEAGAEEPEKVSDKKDAKEAPRFTGCGKARAIMIQGTMSNVGKSVIAAGLCRIFADDGYLVAPFKSQNMALNSHVTKEGLEMGRAQVMQAECARREPSADMNPILLKPVQDAGSQVIVNGKAVGNMKAAAYYREKQRFVPDILAAYDRLSETSDIIVIEGAGSPVEMNLKKDDFVNMGLAEMLDAPVLLVGDIDRGGIFAQLCGTMELFTDAERDRVAGLIVNRFRGDASLFEDGVKILEERCRRKVLGVMPELPVRFEAEDSLAGDFGGREKKAFDIAIIRFSHISNFTDFETFAQLEDVSVRYVSGVSELGDPDLIILPGTKNTIGDLKAIRESGLADAVCKRAKEGCCIIGICGGFQMLGEGIEDPDGVEEGGRETGLFLLPVDTVLGAEKTCANRTYEIGPATGILSGLAGCRVSGYEIHMGKTVPRKELTPFTSEGTGWCAGNVYGTYLHGFFDTKEVLTGIIKAVAASKNKTVSLDAVSDFAALKEKNYQALAQALRKHLDMDEIYRIMGIRR